MSEENIFAQHDVENKQLKEENEKLIKENEQLRNNNVVKDAEIKEYKKPPKEIKSPEEDTNAIDYYLNCFDKNQFKNIIIDSNKFNYRHKISEFRYIEIKDLVNNIKNNAISELSAKKGLNTLNHLKNAGIIKQKNAPLNRKNY